MLRVSGVEKWLSRSPARPDVRTNGDCVIIRTTGGERATGPAGAQALRLHLVMVPPGTRGMPHYHASHETAIYVVSGQAEVWHGAGLSRRSAVRAGDFVYIPPGTPHLAANRGEVTSIVVLAAADPAETEAAVLIELPGHLAGMANLPVTIPH